MPKLEQYQIEFQNWMTNDLLKIFNSESEEQKLLYYALKTGSSKEGKGSCVWQVKYFNIDIHEVIIEAFMRIIKGIDVYKKDYTNKDEDYYYSPPKENVISTTIAAYNGDKCRAFRRLFANNVYLVFKKKRDDAKKYIGTITETDLGGYDQEILDAGGFEKFEGSESCNENYGSLSYLENKYKIQAERPDEYDNFESDYDSELFDEIIYQHNYTSDIRFDRLNEFRAFLRSKYPELDEVIKRQLEEQSIQKIAKDMGLNPNDLYWSIPSSKIRKAFVEFLNIE